MQLPKAMEQLPVVAPLFHIVLCAVFLVGYAAGFGSNIGTLFGLSDLFSLSLNDLALVYITGLLVPLIMIAPRFRNDYVSIGDRLSQSDDPEDHTHLAKMQSTYKWFVRAIFFIMIVSVVPATFFAWQLDQRIPYPEMSGLVTLSITLSWMKYAQKLPTSVKSDLLTAMALCLLAGALIVGLFRGQSERRYSASAFENVQMKCGKMIVVRPLGERFLALDAANKRYVIDDDCKVVFTFPERKAFEPLNVPEMAQRWWQS